MKKKKKKRWQCVSRESERSRFEIVFFFLFPLSCNDSSHKWIRATCCGADRGERSANKSVCIYIYIYIYIYRANRTNLDRGATRLPPFQLDVSLGNGSTYPNVRPWANRCTGKGDEKPASHVYHTGASGCLPSSRRAFRRFSHRHLRRSASNCTDPRFYSTSAVTRRRRVRTTSKEVQTVQWSKVFSQKEELDATETFSSEQAQSILAAEAVEQLTPTKRPETNAF